MAKKWIVPLVCLGMAAMLSGCFLLPKEADRPELPLVTPYNGAEYLTAEVTRGDISREVKVSFSYNPTRRADLRFSVQNRSYGAIYAAVGDEVKEGDLLAELDTAQELEAIRSTETELSRLRIRLSAARTALALAREEEGLRGGYSTVTSDARQADIRYYEAAIAIRTRQLEEQQAALETLRLYAPFDGTVTYVKAIDETTRSGKSDTVVSLADNSSALFTTQTEEWARFPLGETVTVSSAEGDYVCVSRDPADFGLSAEENARGQKNVCLEIVDAQPPEGSLRGEVRMVLEQKQGVLRLPVRAVFTAGDKYYVYHEAENGLKTALEIGCGLSDGSYIEITEGLEEGDHVIVS